jgi:hypothetical protein
LSSTHACILQPSIRMIFKKMNIIFIAWCEQPSTSLDLHCSMPQKKKRYTWSHFASWYTPSHHVVHPTTLCSTSTHPATPPIQPQSRNKSSYLWYVLVRLEGSVPFHWTSSAVSPTMMMPAMILPTALWLSASPLLWSIVLLLPVPCTLQRPLVRFDALANRDWRRARYQQWYQWPAHDVVG